jgi:hypothetical protein
MKRFAQLIGVLVLVNLAIIMIPLLCAVFGWNPYAILSLDEGFAFQMTQNAVCTNIQIIALFVLYWKLKK